MYNPTNTSNTAVILAGGQGTRLQPYISFSSFGSASRTNFRNHYQKIKKK